MHFSYLCCVLQSSQVIFFFMAVLIIRRLLGACCILTVFKIHKPVIWSLWNVLVVCEIVQSVFVVGFVPCLISLQGMKPCYLLQELS
jgi:hypothetical protein